MKPSQPLVKQAEAAFAYYATSSPTARSRFACISPLRQCRTYYDAPSQSRPSSLLSHQAGRLSQKYPAHSWRTFRRRYAKTVEEAKSRQKTGPLSAATVLVFVGTGVGMYFYFRYERERVERQRIAEASKGMGRPKVGGTFELVDQDNRPFASDRLKGKFSLVYFGFSHCPDICPEELDKMATMLDKVEEEIPTAKQGNPDLLPVFITCDPARDTPLVLKHYLAEFHPRIIGLTGTWEQVKAVCRAYRVYFSTPQGVKPGMDYLVDHSIYFYLMDPEGDFVEAIGRQHTAEQAATLITGHMKDWKGAVVK